MNQITRLAIFASGAGSNAQKIIEYFSQDDKKIQVALIVCNNPHAGVLNIAQQHNLAILLINKEQFFKGNAYVDELKKANINYIILAGFLFKIPAKLINAYPEKIINIHPALLPKYGGKGMYGSFVHQAVIDAKEKQSGITIHIVDELYDHGKHLFQKTCDVLPGDTPQTLAQRIHALEHAHFAKVIEEYIEKNLKKQV